MLWFYSNRLQGNFRQLQSRAMIDKTHCLPLFSLIPKSRMKFLNMKSVIAAGIVLLIVDFIILLVARGI